MTSFIVTSFESLGFHDEVGKDCLCPGLDGATPGNLFPTFMFKVLRYRF
jgi:hypothetical protein